MAFSINIGRNTCSISHSKKSLRVGRARVAHQVRSQGSPNTWESWTTGILGNNSISGGSKSPIDTSESRHNGLPNYGIPNPGSCAGYRKSKKNKPIPTGNSDMMQGRKKAWWYVNATVFFFCSNCITKTVLWIASSYKLVAYNCAGHTKSLQPPLSQDTWTECDQR